MTAHSYSSDQGEHLRVIVSIGIVSVLAAWLLHLLLGRVPVSIPWWIDTPSVLGFFAVFRTAFDRSLWRNKLIRKAFAIAVPDLNGGWKGHGSGRWRGIIVPGLRHEGSDQVFIAARGPGIVATNAYDMAHCATSSQIAATLLESLGLLDAERQPDMAPPLDIFGAR